MAKNDRKLREKRAAEIEKQILEYQKRTGHRRPVTRREFLSAGIINFSGMMFLPSVLDMMARVNPAFAAECPTTTQGNSLIPFITVNLNGGWSAVRNWLPRDIGGQLLPNYNRLGNGRNPTTVTAFATNALFTQNSDQRGFLAGVKQTANAATMANTAFIGSPVRSGDDTGNNRFDVGGLLQAANLVGQKLPNMGQRDTPTGLNHQAAFNRNPTQPLRVGSINDITGALGFVGSLATLNRNQQLSLARTVQNLSISQARELASLSGGQNIANLVECATGKNVENVQQGGDSVDPRQVPAIANSGIWNLNNGGELARAAMVMNALNGLAGAVGIELGGYDYHRTGIQNIDNRDLQAGRLIGQILQTASVMQRPVFIYVISDGSVSFDVSDTAITEAAGDNGGNGCNMILAYNPNGAPQARGSQLGGFTAGQAADNSVPWGGNPEMNAAAVFANWATLSTGNTALATRVLGNTFSTAQLNQLLMFG